MVFCAKRWRLYLETYKKVRNPTCRVSYFNKHDLASSVFTAVHGDTVDSATGAHALG